jgi:hypothetical protein
MVKFSKSTLGKIIKFIVAVGSLVERYPRAVIVGHHDLNPHKACPCIENVAREYADLQPK